MFGLHSSVFELFFYEFCACLYVCVTVERDEINPLKACECFIVCVFVRMFLMLSRCWTTHMPKKHTQVPDFIIYAV